jgi:hypothetical protein
VATSWASGAVATGHVKIKFMFNNEIKKLAIWLKVQMLMRRFSGLYLMAHGHAPPKEELELIKYFVRSYVQNYQTRQELNDKIKELVKSSRKLN